VSVPGSGTSEGDRGSPPAGSRSRLSVDLAATACFLAGVVGGISAFSPWWFVTTSSTATSSSAYYYPGTDTTVVTDGGGGTTTYAAVHVPSVGDLCVLVLVGAIVLTLASFALAVYGLGYARGRWGTSRGRAAARRILLAAVLVGLLLVVVVPIAQPALFRTDDPMGACSGPSPLGECSAFWGASHAGGVATSWGGGFGWWLALSATVLLVGALLAGTVSATAPASPFASPSRAAPRRPPVERGPVLLAELERLSELKARSDRGEIPESEFLEAKRRLLAAAPRPGTEGPGAATPLPADELSALRQLRDAGALTEAEYETLERRALLWI
jgi:hypothetical protein